MRTTIAFSTAIFSIFISLVLSALLSENLDQVKELRATVDSMQTQMQTEKETVAKIQVQITENEKAQYDLNIMNTVNTAYVMNAINAEEYSNFFYKTERAFSGTIDLATKVKKSIK